MSILWARLYARLRSHRLDERRGHGRLAARLRSSARLFLPVGTLVAIGLVESAGRRWC
jgi:hypothetical protein